MTTFQPGDVSAFAEALSHDVRALAAVTAPTLSPQAALDVVLDAITYAPGEGWRTEEWTEYGVPSTAHETTTITARKADGHWQVKSVGGGE